MSRLFKIVLVAFVGLNGLVYFSANIANFDAARGAVSAVISMADRPWYPNALIPALTGEGAATVGLIVILTGEFLVGALSLLGAVNMASAYGKSAAVFQDAKRFAIAGCAMSLVVWYGGFTVIGGALFQMWQTDLGQASLGDAQKYLIPAGIILLWLTMRDE